MKRKRKKDFYYYMRTLHRDLGFITIGLTVVFALSGSLLVFRDTPFMKVEKLEEMQLEAGLDGLELSQKVRVRGFRVERIEEHMIYFNSGSYNQETGETMINRMVYPSPIDKLVDLHKVTSKSPMAWIAAIYGFILTFFAISGMLMFRVGSPNSKRAFILTVGSIVLTVLVVIFT